MALHFRGLYPNERKAVTRYIPLSLTLFVAGVVFVYFVVLPLTVNFFLAFNAEMPSPIKLDLIVKGAKGMPLPVFDGDPEDQSGPSIWFNKIDEQLKIRLPATDILAASE